VSDYPKAVAEGWHPIASAGEFGRKPLARILLGRPIVLFKSAGGPAAFLDRCPHRNMPLSAGRVRDGEIECPYHGWRFAADGRCTLTPGADQPAAQRAEALPIIERAGLVWTNLARDPAEFPALPSPIGDERFDGFWWLIRPSRARLLDTIENFLDPAHPHFLHAGIVRSGATRRPVAVTVTIRGDHAEATYIENTRASGLMPRLLEGLRSASIGRFFPPSIGQIVFEGPSGPRLAVTVFFTPEAADRIRPIAHFATPKGLAPAVLKKALLKLFNRPVVVQDRAALRAQFDNVARFGAPHYALGPLDFLLPAIRQLAAGEAPDAQDRHLTINL
jgi:phenylpropionate dioxygenase-like ring-hydroxylating dioxygenase large terminal subunit